MFQPDFVASASEASVNAFERSKSFTAFGAANVAERRVVRQLVEALLFEGLVTYDASARGAHDATNAPASIYDRYLEFTLRSDRYRCVATVAAFGRVRIAEGSIERLLEETSREARLTEIMAALDVSDRAKETLRRELGQTVTLSLWNYENLPHQHLPRRGLGFQELESAIVEGHLYHPSFKSRTGFTLFDHEAYGSEAGRRFQLSWLAITRSSLRLALPSEEEAFWRHELGAEIFAVLTQRLEARAGNWEQYALVPIHPWQLGSISGLASSDAFTNGEIILLGPAGDFYHASQSLRTLVNASNPKKPNVKLPLNVVCTSARRNLEPHFICTAPVLSQWLTRLVERDSFLQSGDRVLLLREYAAIAHEPRASVAESSAQLERARDFDGLIGAIFRESLNGRLQPGEAAVPFTALMLVESDQRPFIADWLETHGVEVWVKRLLDVMLIPIWHMLVHHGVAFEAHAQNLILVHKNGWPHKLALRDFHESLEFVREYLARPELVPDFAQVDPFFATVPDDVGYRMASTDALRELFMDTVYVYNLTELSFLLWRFCAFEEQRFWDLVRSRLAAYARSGITPRARIERLACDSETIVVESLLTKKLMGGNGLDCFEHTITNTLRSSAAPCCT